MLFSINSVPKICAPNLCPILCPICAPFGAHGAHSFCAQFSMAPWLSCCNIISFLPCHLCCNNAMAFAMANAMELLQHKWHGKCHSIVITQVPWRHGKCHGIVTTQVPWQNLRIVLQHKGQTWQMGHKNYMPHVPQMGHKLGTNFGYWINTEKHKNNLLNFVFGKVYVLQMGYAFGVQYRVQQWI